MADENKDTILTISLCGKIDSGNAADTETNIIAQLAGKSGAEVMLDVTELKYISSAGLRVILRLKKTCPLLKIIGANSEVYEIFEMSGFTEMMTVEKAYRTGSVEGCEVIGEGANGKVYRIDGDNVVKTYKNADSLADIRHERVLSRLNPQTFEIKTEEPDNPNELEIEATAENLQNVIGFIDSRLGGVDCPPKAKMQLDIAVEEIFVNIANYAYAPGKGKATVRVEVSEEPVTVAITFIDRGVPYDPLKKDDPDITLSAAEREIGGLGIFMTKKVMDDVNYEYKDGQNILTLKKRI